LSGLALYRCVRLVGGITAAILEFTFATRKFEFELPSMSGRLGNQQGVKFGARF
jgi:hypothetical protein